MDTDRPTTLIWKISNGDISATGHLTHFMFGSGVGFGGWWIEWRYFRLDQIQDGRSLNIRMERVIRFTFMKYSEISFALE